MWMNVLNQPLHCMGLIGTILTFHSIPHGHKHQCLNGVQIDL